MAIIIQYKEDGGLEQKLSFRQKKGFSTGTQNCSVRGKRITFLLLNQSFVQTPIYRIFGRKKDKNCPFMGRHFEKSFLLIWVNV